MMKWAVLAGVSLLFMAGAVPVMAFTAQEAKLSGYVGIEANPDQFDFSGMPMKIPASEIEKLSNGKIKVGMTITKNNVAGMKDELIKLTTPGIYNMVTRGMELVIADYKPWPVPKAYGAVTKKNMGQGVLTADGNVKMKSGGWWEGGEPFFDLDAKDDNAAMKAWYNQVHVYDGDDFTHDAVAMFYVSSAGQLERKVEMSWDRIFLSGREILDPKPFYDDKVKDILFKELIYVQAPADLQGFGNLNYRYNDQNRPDDSFAYIPAMRRVRRLSSGQRFDSFIGSDPTLGDFRTHDVPLPRWNWKLVEVGPKLTTLFSFDNIEENKLAVNHHPSTMGIKFPKANWRLWPNTFVLEATPKTKNDCPVYSKKILWVHGGSWRGSMAECYDNQGKLWKTIKNFYFGYGEGKKLQLLAHYENDFYTYDHVSDHASPWHVDFPHRKFQVGFTPDRFSTKYLQRFGH
jgi:hypothetical protein